MESNSSAKGEAIAFINRNLGKDLKSFSKIEKLRAELEKQRDQLSKQVALANQEIPTKINSAVSEGKDAEKSIAELINQCEYLHQRTEQHLEKCLPLLPSLQGRTREIQHVEKYLSYLHWIMKVEEISASIQTSLLAGSMTSGVDAFSELVDLSQHLSSTSCYFLYNFARDTVLYWYDIIKEKLAQVLEKNLKILGYPVVEGPSNPGQTVTNVSPANRASFETVLSQLLNVQLPASFGVSCGLPKTMLHKLSVFGCSLEPFSLPMQFVLNPLKKRFKFHFFGDRPTNNLSKPEWYFSQALSWLSVHANTFDEIIQPAFDRISRTRIKAKAEFIRGMSLMVMEKLQSDIPELLYDESLFCHTVNEALFFHRSLVEGYDYPSVFPSVLHILCEEKAFQRWITVEKKFAQERIDSMLASPSAWKSPQTVLTDASADALLFSASDDGTCLRVPECTESFVTQLHVLKERSVMLPGPLPKLHFLELQLNLLEDFHLRMTQVKGGEKGNPMGIKFTSVLNGIHYVLTVLQDWREHPHYIQLSWYNEQYASMVADTSVVPVEMTTNTATVTDVSVSALETSKSYTFSALSLFSERLKVSDLSGEILKDKLLFDPTAADPSDGTAKSIFDKIIQTYDHLRKTMLKDIVYAVMIEVKSRSQAYKKEKWLQIPPTSDWVSPNLSSSACEMLLILKSRFHILGLYLSPPNMTLIWQRIARDLNKYIYEEVILPNHFSEGGAAQLKYDMERNLFPVFAEFTAKPENYFKEVKEAFTLLTLPLGSARLLKDTIVSFRNASNAGGLLGSDGGEGARDSLAEFGIHKLSTEHSLALLSQQTSLIASA